MAAPTNIKSYDRNNENIPVEFDEEPIRKTSQEPIGNVLHHSAVPVGYNGGNKKGNLIFDASFESGNLGRVDYISDFEYDLFVRPDTCNARFRVWFNFTVRNASPYQRVIFNIVNFSKTKSLYRGGMSPVVKSSSRSKWQRIPTKNVFYYRCPDHRKNYVMSFAFCFDKEEDTYQFSYSYPYTYSRVQKYLNQLQKRAMDYFSRDQLCLSAQQRKVDILTITSKGDHCGKKVVFFTARVHPGETPASFVCQGIIDFLISQHPIARVLREYIIFKIVPMLNPDGVVLGNYRSSLMGFDLNRYWHEPSPWAHPSIVAAKNAIMALDSNKDVDFDFFIDIHAHSTLTNAFMYGNIYDNEERYERQMIFPRLLYGNAEDFSMENTSFNRDAVKAGTGRRFLGNALNAGAHCYTLEVSFSGYSSSIAQIIMPYTEEAYYKLGRNVARTFLDYYKLASGMSPSVRRPILAERSKQFAEEKSSFAEPGQNIQRKPQQSYTILKSRSSSSSDSNCTASFKLTHKKSK